MRISLRMWRGDKIPRSRAVGVDFSHKPSGYEVFLREVLPLRWTGGPAGVILELILRDDISFRDQYFPQFLRLLLYDSFGLSEMVSSVLRTGARESLPMRESGQVSTLLKILQEIRSGQVAKARAERFPASDERGIPGSIHSPQRPTTSFQENERP